MRPTREHVAWAALVVLAVATAYELLVATEVVPMGDAPGEEASGGA